MQRYRVNIETRLFREFIVELDDTLDPEDAHYTACELAKKKNSEIIYGYDYQIPEVIDCTWDDDEPKVSMVTKVVTTEEDAE